MVYFAPAKINLHLDIRDRRDDGFHELESIFIMVDIYDIVDIRLADGHSGVTITGNPFVAPGEDIMLRAAELYIARTGVGVGVDINICKRIPAGRGLGGGSSDAACVLKALDALLGRNIEREQLRTMAAELGSDVPFFLEGPAALVRGRGELTTPFAPERKWWVLLTVPGFHIATRDAYKWLDDDRNHNLIEKNEPVHLTTSLPVDYQDWAFFNTFSQVLFRRQSELARIVQSMKQSGAIFSSVSGSGSACFGLFESYKDASKAAEGMSCRWIYVKETLASAPYTVLQ